MQRNPVVGNSDDHYEREANAAAAHVLRNSNGFLASRAWPATRPAVDAVNGGYPLPAEVRAFFEPRFHADFSKVRIHSDTTADTAARSVGALAYTRGNDIVFRTGRYEPITDGGRHLLAHELAHVVQQQGHGARSAPRQQFDQAAGAPVPPRLLHDFSTIPVLHAATPRLQRQDAVTGASPRQSIQAGTTVRNWCRLRSGTFAWAIVPGTGSSGACFNVQIVFLPGTVQVFRAGSSPLSPAIGARFVPDPRPIAFVQTVATINRSSHTADQPAVDVLPRDTDPYYGARWDRASGSWTDESTSTQGCGSLPRATASPGFEGGSRFSRGRSYGAVVNDGPSVNPNERKDFQTTAVVMETAEPLGSLTWAVEHNGTQAVVGPINCHESPQPNVEFGTPGHDEMLRGYYRTSPRSVVDGFARNNASLPAGAPSILDAVASTLTSGRIYGSVVVSGAATSDEDDPVGLSRARAESVAAYLVQHGVARTAITVEARGASSAREPVYSVRGAESANRRVQLMLLPPAQ